MDKDYDNKSNISDNPKYDNSDLFEDNNNAAADDDIDETADRDSGYNTNKNCDAELDKFREAIWKYKALCYKDICLWIVQNPKREERDLFAIKVLLKRIIFPATLSAPGHTPTTSATNFQLAVNM